MLRILDHAWHQAHSYRLHALPADFWYYQIGPRTWNVALRPMPPNFRGFVCDYRRGEFDVILMHLDQWCDHRFPLRGMPYRIMNLIARENSPGTPRICIMHGTPDSEENRQRILKLIANTPGGPPFVVCNSRQAQAEWGIERSRAIIHGYDVDEFWSERTRRVQVITVCSGGYMSRSYHGIPLLERIRREVPVTWIGERGDLPTFSSYREYREYLSTALVYLHTGQRSPMPGARTEAMLSGCCVVSTDNHDISDYIEHGVNGFITNDAEEMIGTLKALLAEPERAYSIGRWGRETARACFSKERYVAEWMELLGELGVV